jgi:hypothetical protein
MKNILKIALASVFTITLLTFSGITGYSGPAYAIDIDPDPDPEEKVKGNNGLGNGDQRAPGNSLDRNRAENHVGNSGHSSNKPQNPN